MCGIVGYVGPRLASPLLLEGLKRLEYRGYDSAGVAIMNGKGVETRKAPGKISELETLVAAAPIHGTLGIAHTRWATHGAPTDRNAHPHVDCSGAIAVVHNGTLENFTALRDDLEHRGHTLLSETDTEAVAHLIEERYDGDLAAAVRSVCADLDGSFVLVVSHGFGEIKSWDMRTGAVHVECYPGCSGGGGDV